MCFKASSIALKKYWIFVLIGALSRLDSYHTLFTKKGNAIAAMVMPYINVFRMQVMILVLAISKLFNMESLVLYVALFLYFFPWGIVLGICLNPQ